MEQIIVQKPWGHEVLWARTSTYVGKLLVVKPACRLSRQYHEKKTETFIVLNGSMVLEVGDPKHGSFHTLEMPLGSSFHCEAGTVHRICAGPQGCTLGEVSTPELDDVVRLDDDFARTA
jgi:quercetin dioxygenase-like cupin family protein